MFSLIEKYKKINAAKTDPNQKSQKKKGNN